MKYQISAMDLHFLTTELREILVNAKGDKVFQPSKKEFLMLFHAPGKGKQMLKVNLPNAMFLTDFKGEMPEEPSGFCRFLRKYMSGARLREINQHGFERIVEFAFESKQGNFILIIELFSRGNMILTDVEYTIKSVLEAKKWKDRTLRGNVKYEFPEPRKNPLEIPEAGFAETIKSTEKESIVKTLALDLGLGGVYAEELCKRAGVEKATAKAEPDQIKALFTELKKLRESRLSPNVAMQDDKPAAILPIEFLTFPEKKPYQSLNEALDEVLTAAAIEDIEAKAEEPQKKEMERLKKQVAQQEEQIAELEKTAAENKKKGELIYSNYQLITDILAEINKAREKYSFQEIREKLKGHPVVKEVDGKNKEIHIELKP